mmetsp:Transcript_7509/g.13366  ORF Transcript_7509/g.13366 Transcript_7509/m.13366 type:complete len:263 (-) Transcript_7509:723-1511(-)
MLEGHDDLDHTGKTGDSLEVTDVGLNAANSDLLLLVAVGTVEEVTESGELNTVTNGGTGTVALNKSDGGGIDVSAHVGTAKSLLLTRDGRGVNTGGLTVRGRGAAANDSVNLVTITNSVGVTFKHKHGRAFANKHTLGLLIVCADARVGREHRGLGEGHVHTDGVIRAGSTSDHHVTVSVEKLINGNLNGDERTSTGSIDDTVHTIEVEGVGTATGSNVAEETGEGVKAPLREVGLVLLNSSLNILLRHAHLAKDLLNDNIV